LVVGDLRLDHYELRFHYYIWTIGTLSKPTECVRHMGGSILTLPPPKDGRYPLRIYSGQYDEKDPSKVQMWFEMKGWSGWIDVHLVDEDRANQDDTTRVEEIHTVGPAR
jgi:hypothetical protein